MLNGVGMKTSWPCDSEHGRLPSLLEAELLARPGAHRPSLAESPQRVA